MSVIVPLCLISLGIVSIILARFELIAKLINSTQKQLANIIDFSPIIYLIRQLKLIDINLGLVEIMQESLVSLKLFMIEIH